MNNKLMRWILNYRWELEARRVPLYKRKRIIVNKFVDSGMCKQYAETEFKNTWEHLREQGVL